MPSFELGESIPPFTAHAISVSLPTWQSNVGYEENQEWVISRMSTGYPRFFIHKGIEDFARDIVVACGQAGCRALLFSTPMAANRCLEFIKLHAPSNVSGHLQTVHLALDVSKHLPLLLQQLSPTVSATIFPQQAYNLAKQYWQHTGDGASSRRAEVCHRLFRDGILVPIIGSRLINKTQPRPIRGPRRYQRPESNKIASVQANMNSLPSISTEDHQESNRFLEERFGRNLDLSLVEQARSAICRRIAGSLSQQVDLQDGLPLPPVTPNTRGQQRADEDDVYLFPAGMNAIFHIHRALLAVRGQLESISFGFPYVDSLKILQKFGPGCAFFGHGSSGELDDLERLLQSGQRYLGLFCEFPGNPLLSCPDLRRIRRLADEFDLAVVVDDTIGTFANINVLSMADVVVSSLTKIFSGDSNVMGGSAILNPESKFYDPLKRVMHDIFEDAYWAEDIVFMERNSRDFMARINRINSNAEVLCNFLRRHPLVKSLYYPKFNTSRHHFDAHRLPNGGYGGLLSLTFHHKEQAQAFYDAIEVAKGPSLGTNFTLCSPYVLLAHYHELSWAAQFGVDPDLVRVSVGLEDSEILQIVFGKALKAAEAVCPPL